MQLDRELRYFWMFWFHLKSDLMIGNTNEAFSHLDLSLMIQKQEDTPPAHQRVTLTWILTLDSITHTCTSFTVTLYGLLFIYTLCEVLPNQFFIPFGYPVSFCLQCCILKLWLCPWGMECLSFVHLSGHDLQNVQGCNLIGSTHFHISFWKFWIPWQNELFGAINSQRVKVKCFQNLELLKSVHTW